MGFLNCLPMVPIMIIMLIMLIMLMVFFICYGVLDCSYALLRTYKHRENHIDIFCEKTFSIVSIILCCYADHNYMLYYFDHNRFESKIYYQYAAVII